MKYNPQNTGGGKPLPNRRSIRLKGYDYSQTGLYFITICCEGRECRFGKIENGEMILNEYGTIAYNEWTKLPERFTNFELDVFQIMPNHMHGIIVLNDAVGATLAVAQNTPAPNVVTENNVGAGFTPDQNGDANINANTQSKTGQPQGLPLQQISGDDNRARVNRAPTIGDIVGAYKSLVANACLEIYKTKNEMMEKLWQRNYHEHIIRNEQSYQTISYYIINNPAKWNDDKFYTV